MPAYTGVGQRSGRIRSDSRLVGHQVPGVQQLQSDRSRRDVRRQTVLNSRATGESHSGGDQQKVSVTLRVPIGKAVIENVDKRNIGTSVRPMSNRKDSLTLL